MPSKRKNVTPARPTRKLVHKNKVEKRAAARRDTAEKSSQIPTKPASSHDGFFLLGKVALGTATAGLVMMFLLFQEFGPMSFRLVRRDGR
jgi:hypothetical protein